MTGELTYEATVHVKATKLAGLQEFYNYMSKPLGCRLTRPDHGHIMVRIESFIP